MKAERILLPLDIRKCPLEFFSVVNGLASQPGDTVILLHVVTLNIAVPENRVYEELGRDARWYLERLARECLRPGVATNIRVRLGKPAEEILAEAAAGNADLIILSAYPPSFWKQVFGPTLSRIVARVIRKAPCNVVRVNVQDRFNCEDAWGRSGHQSGTGLDHLDEALDSKTSPELRTEDAFASAQESHPRRCLTASTEPPITGFFVRVAALPASPA
jgi:nucleotide-binding universal stress UspA family protein